MSAPEKVLLPGYWGTHNLDDSCPAKRVNFAPLSDAEKQANLEITLDLRVREVEACELVIAVLAKGQKPMNVLTAGDIFDGREYPLGTVLRINSESLTRHKKLTVGALWRSFINMSVEPLNWGEPEYAQGTPQIAVLTESEYFPELHKLRLVSFFEYPFKQGNAYKGSPYQRGYDQRGYIKVGEVEHIRRGDNMFGANDSETLKRVTKVEILSRGR